MQQQFKDEDEYIMVQEQFKPLFTKSSKERLVYAITTDNIYTFADNLKTREYSIKDVSAILVVSTNKTDFMLFFERSDDLTISQPNRKDMLDLLKLRFNCLNRNITLRVFSVTNDEIKELIKNNTKQTKANGIIDLPEDSQRLLDDEIKGEEEYNEDLRRKKAQIDDGIFDFDQVDTNFQEQDGEMTLDSNVEDDQIRMSVMVGSRKESDYKLVDF